MSAMLNGKAQLERVILPQLSKAIAGCMKYNEMELLRILEQWKSQATQFLYPITVSSMPPANVAQRANIEASISNVETINSSPSKMKI